MNGLPADYDWLWMLIRCILSSYRPLLTKAYVPVPDDLLSKINLPMGIGKNHHKICPQKSKGNMNQGVKGMTFPQFGIIKKQLNDESARPKYE